MDLESGFIINLTPYPREPIMRQGQGVQPAPESTKVQ